MQQKAQVCQIEIFAHHLFTRCFDKNSARVAVCVKFSHDGMQGASKTQRKKTVILKDSKRKMALKTI